MTKSTADIIKSLRESPDGKEGVGWLDNLQIQGVLKHLLAYHDVKDLEIKNLNKQVRELKAISKTDRAGHHLEMPRYADPLLSYFYNKCISNKPYED